MKLLALVLVLLGCSTESAGLESPDTYQATTPPTRGTAVLHDAGAADTMPAPDTQPAPVTVPDTDALDARPCVAPAGVCVYSTGSTLDALITACYANGAIVQKGVATGVTVYTTRVAGRVCEASATAPAGFPSGDANDPATTCTLGPCPP
jgi:hypothetical protein